MKLKQCPDYSPLGVKFIFSDKLPLNFHMRSDGVKLFHRYNFENNIKKS